MNADGTQIAGGMRKVRSITGTPGQPYALTSTTNLNSVWQPLATGTADVSGTFLFNVAETVPTTFYRLNTNN